MRHCLSKVSRSGPFVQVLHQRIRGGGGSNTSLISLMQGVQNVEKPADVILERSLTVVGLRLSNHWEPHPPPFGLNPISRKKYLISNLIIYFRFPRACVRNYTMRALLQNACTTTKCMRYCKIRALLKNVCATTKCVQYFWRQKSWVPTILGCMR